MKKKVTCKKSNCCARVHEVRLEVPVVNEWEDWRIWGYKFLLDTV